MWHVLSLLSINAVLSTSAASWNYQEPLNIQGGRIDTIENKPYVVSIISGNVNQKCGGSIISTEYVLSSKHCLRTATPSNLRIRAGSSKWKEGGTLHAISSCWTRFNQTSDIAIVKVDPPFTFNQHCRPIELPDAGSTVQPGISGVVSGWGDMTWMKNTPSDELRSVTLPIIDRTTCSVWMVNRRPLYPDEFCASYMSLDRDEGFCKGDSGGPFVIDNKLIGIVRRRRGEGMASKTSGQIFIDVSYHRQWITQITGI